VRRERASNWAAKIVVVRGGGSSDARNEKKREISFCALIIILSVMWADDF
jgi:hypothetical protein